MNIFRPWHWWVEFHGDHRAAVDWAIRITGGLVVILVFSRIGCISTVREDPSIAKARFDDEERQRQAALAKPIPPLKVWTVGESQRSENNLQVRVIVSRVHRLPGKRMRWFFSFLNEGLKDAVISVDLGRAYLADDEGNRYAVEGDEKGTNPKGNFRGIATAGVRLDYWMDFPVMKDDATSFLVSLPSRLQDQRVASFNNFKVRLETEGGSGAVVTGPLQIWPIGQTQESTNPPGFTLKVVKVELLRGDKMRWYLSVLNHSGRDGAFTLALGMTYLADGNGNRYAVLADERGNAPDRTLSLPVQAGVRIDYWLEFPAPKDGAKSFSARFIDNPYDEGRFSKFQVKLFD